MMILIRDGKFETPKFVTSPKVWSKPVVRLWFQFRCIFSPPDLERYNLLF